MRDESGIINERFSGARFISGGQFSETRSVSYAGMSSFSRTSHHSSPSLESSCKLSFIRSWTSSSAKVSSARATIPPGRVPPCPKLIATPFLSPSIYPASCRVVPCPLTTVSLIKPSSSSETSSLSPRFTSPRRFADVPDHAILIDRRRPIDPCNEPDEHKEQLWYRCNDPQLQIFCWISGKNFILYLSIDTMIN